MSKWALAQVARATQVAAASVLLPSVGESEFMTRPQVDEIFIVLSDSSSLPVMRRVGSLHFIN